MRNHNRAPRWKRGLQLAALGLGGLLTACGTTSETGNGAAADSSPAVTAETVAPIVPAKKSDNQSNCTGVLGGVRYVNFSKEGDVFEITSVQGGDCLPIYESPDPSTTQVLGSLSVGDKIFGLCAFEEDVNQAPRLRTYTFDEHTDYGGNLPVAPGVTAELNADIMQVAICVPDSRPGFTQPN